jgi:membrane-associated phospholipid phosphatase
MALRCFVLVIVIGATIPVWAQEPTGQDTAPAQETQLAQDTRPAQETQTPEISKTENPPEPEAHGSRLHWRDIPKNVLHDEKAIFTSPFHINRENAKWWILFGAATGVLIANDQRISDSLPQKTVVTKASTWASRLGADYSIYPLWGTFYLVGKAGDNPRARDTGRIGIEALIDADITANILKLATQRPRPEHQGDKLGFFTGGDAFPSGHAIKSWALARVAAREFPDKKVVPILAYSAASVVSLARFGGRRHSASDALAGSAMGFFIGDFVYRHHHAPSEKSNALSWLSTHVDVGFNIGGH